MFLEESTLPVLLRYGDRILLRDPNYGEYGEIESYPPMSSTNSCEKIMLRPLSVVVEESMRAVACRALNINALTAEFVRERI